MKPHARHKARSLALQAIFQWQFTADSINALEAQYFIDLNYKKTDAEYLSNLIKGTIENITTIDEVMASMLDRKISELSKVECAILRLSTYELLYRFDVPYKVIINEALELAKKFGTSDGYKYINGVLDKVARSPQVTKIRPISE
jgi:transcription antitermination protein NusB